MGCPLMEPKLKSQKQLSLGPLVKLEVLVCTTVLFGSLGYLIYVAYLYSEHYNEGGMLFGSLQTRRGLHKGWMFGNRLQDLTDDMWRRFHFTTRLGAPLWYIGAALLRSQMRKRLPQHEGKIMAFFYLAYALHIHRGAKVIVLIAYVVFNFYLSKLVAGRKYGPACIWGYNFLWLSLSKRKNFRKWMIRHSTAPIWGMGDVHLKMPFVVMFFKCISYGMDLHWARVNQPSFHGVVKKDTDEDAYKARIDQHLPKDWYGSILSYIQYQFYPALYIDGPIITFNDFMTQAKGRIVRNQKVFWYGLRALAMFIVLDTYYHFVYAEAIAQSNFYQESLFRVSNFLDKGSMPSFGTLAFMALINCCYLNYYLSHLVVWKFARFWSLVDGIDCPDDFTKCIGRCLNMREIWRHWHASLTKWCIRYAYIPLGGSRGSTFSTCINIGVVFSITALWHNYDLDFALWGAMLTAFITVEMVVQWLGKSPLPVGAAKQPIRTKLRQTQDTSEWSQRISALGTAAPMLGFIFINMATFTFGQNQTWDILKDFWRDPQFLVWWGLMAYSDQRLVTIHNSWTRNKEKLNTSLRHDLCTSHESEDVGKGVQMQTVFE